SKPPSCWDLRIHDHVVIGNGSGAWLSFASRGKRTLASMQEAISMQPPRFNDDFRRQFRELLAWRRDVRRFRRQPIDPAILGELLSLARLAPSVGNSQPWRFVLVEEPVRRAEIRDVFTRYNEAAQATYSDTRDALHR